MIRKKLSKLNETLLDLIIGIFLIDVVFGILGMILTKGNWFYLLGIIAGMTGAIVFSIMILYYIEGALNMSEKNARNYILRGLFLRTLIVLLLGIIAVKIHIYCLVGLMIALMGMKISAFMQPFVNRWITRNILGGEICSSLRNQ